MDEHTWNIDMTNFITTSKNATNLRWKVVWNDKDLSKEMTMTMRNIKHGHDITTTSKQCYEFTMEGVSERQDQYQEADFQIL